jgi:hypothetical protein
VLLTCESVMLFRELLPKSKVLLFYEQVMLKRVPMLL